MITSGPSNVIPGPEQKRPDELPKLGHFWEERRLPKMTVLDDAGNPVDLADKYQNRFVQVNEFHRRTLATAIGKGGTMTDLKGIPLERPTMRLVGRFLRLDGILLSRQIEEVAHTSQLFHERDLPTERVTQVYTLATVPDDDGREIPWGDFKASLLASLDDALRLKENRNRNDPNLRGDGVLEEEQILRLRTLIENSHAVIIERELPFPLRAIDVAAMTRHDEKFKLECKKNNADSDGTRPLEYYYDAGQGAQVTTDVEKVISDLTTQCQEELRTTEDEGKKMLVEKSYESLIRNIRVKKTEGPVMSDTGLKTAFRAVFAGLKVRDPGLARLNYENPGDILEYFEKIFPQRIGAFLAKMHDLDFSHGFAHGQNWTATGELVDLDSVRGVIRGGEETEEMFLLDIERTFDAIDAVFGLGGLGRDMVSMEGSVFSQLGFDGKKKLWDAREKAYVECIRSYAAVSERSNEFVKRILPKLDFRVDRFPAVIPDEYRRQMYDAIEKRGE